MFLGCRGLKTIVIPASVRMFDMHPLRDCKSLTSIIYDTTDPVAISSWNFNRNVFNNAVLYMPAEGIEEAKYMDGWSRFKHIEPIENWPGYESYKKDI